MGVPGEGNVRIWGVSISFSIGVNKAGNQIIQSSGQSHRVLGIGDSLSSGFGELDAVREAV